MVALFTSLSKSLYSLGTRNPGRHSLCARKLHEQPEEELVLFEQGAYFE